MRNPKPKWLGKKDIAHWLKPKNQHEIKESIDYLEENLKTELTIEERTEQESALAQWKYVRYIKNRGTQEVVVFT